MSEPVGISREPLGQYLERDVASELRVGGAIHFAHATFTDLVDHAIGAEHSPNHCGATV
jgi:hypothetical protein